MAHQGNYSFFKYLDSEIRILGLTLDAFIPVVLMGFIGFLCHLMLMGIGGSFLIFFVVRHLKKGQGSSWVLNRIYWFFPPFFLEILGRVFKKTPPSYQRFWLR